MDGVSGSDSWKARVQARLHRWLLCTGNYYKWHQHREWTLIKNFHAVQCKTHKRLKERFLIGQNRTKHVNFRGSLLFQATNNIKTTPNPGSSWSRLKIPQLVRFRPMTSQSAFWNVNPRTVGAWWMMVYDLTLWFCFVLPGEGSAVSCRLQTVLVSAATVQEDRMPEHSDPSLGRPLHHSCGPFWSLPQ